MRKKSFSAKVKTFTKELFITTLGVLIALLINNYKEDSQARRYHTKSMETIKREVQLNLKDLQEVLQKQIDLRDTVTTYTEQAIPLADLIGKAGGLKLATLSHNGLEFYSKNEIGAIDFETMSMLVQMKTLSQLIDTKMEKLMDFVYPNIFVDSKESKVLFSIYFENVLESEQQLIEIYEHFIELHEKASPEASK